MKLLENPFEWENNKTQSAELQNLPPFRLERNSSRRGSSLRSTGAVEGGGDGVQSASSRRPFSLGFFGHRYSIGMEQKQGFIWLVYLVLSVFFVFLRNLLGILLYFSRLDGLAKETTGGPAFCLMFPKLPNRIVLGDPLF